jgi:hypothetical protein
MLLAGHELGNHTWWAGGRSGRLVLRPRPWGFGVRLGLCAPMCGRTSSAALFSGLTLVDP